jgi:hypothetical protein
MNCNLAFSKLFGYFKKEIISQNIGIIMPSMFVEPHQKMLQVHVESLEEGFNNFLINS